MTEKQLQNSRKEQWENSGRIVVEGGKSAAYATI